MTSFASRIGTILHTPLSRKGFLTCLGGIAVGVPAGAVARDLLREPDPEGGIRSYSQAGEDAAADFFFRHFGISPVTYLDIGAYDPVEINNTYLFYRKGYRGVLVEPNLTMCEKLRRVRPKDTTLAAGIGVAAAREADYYLMSEPAWNTFSKEEAEHEEEVTKKGIYIRKIVKMPLLNINDVIEEHFGKAPTFVSIDAEGLHLAILKTLDFGRYRPPLICIETLVSGTRDAIPEIPQFMGTQGYVDRGGSCVNTLFVDSKLLR